MSQVGKGWMVRGGGRTGEHESGGRGVDGEGGEVGGQANELGGRRW